MLRFNLFGKVKVKFDWFSFYSDIFMFFYSFETMTAVDLYNEAKHEERRANLGGGNIIVLKEVGRMYKEAGIAFQGEGRPINDPLVRECERKARQYSAGQLEYNEAQSKFMDVAFSGNPVAVMSVGAMYGGAATSARLERNRPLQRRAEGASNSCVGLIRAQMNEQATKILFGK
jgi:hypothetical protein